MSAGRYFPVVEAAVGIAVVDPFGSLGRYFPTIRTNPGHLEIGKLQIVKGRPVVTDLKGRVVPSIIELSGFPVEPELEE